MRGETGDARGVKNKHVLFLSDEFSLKVVVFDLKRSRDLILEVLGLEETKLQFYTVPRW